MRAILAVATDYLVIPRKLAAHLTLSAAPPAQSSLASSLTAREQDVLAYLVQGFANEGIAHTLGISVATVRTHVAHLLHKLGVDNHTQAALIAVDRALLSR